MGYNPVNAIESINRGGKINSPAGKTVAQNTNQTIPPVNSAPISGYDPRNAIEAMEFWGTNFSPASSPSASSEAELLAAVLQQHGIAATAENARGILSLTVTFYVLKNKLGIAKNIAEMSAAEQKEAVQKAKEYMAQHPEIMQEVFLKLKDGDTQVVALAKEAVTLSGGQELEISPPEREKIRGVLQTAGINVWNKTLAPLLILKKLQDKGALKLENGGVLINGNLVYLRNASAETRQQALETLKNLVPDVSKITFKIEPERFGDTLKAEILAAALVELDGGENIFEGILLAFGLQQDNLTDAIFENLSENQVSAKKSELLARYWPKYFEEVLALIKSGQNQTVNQALAEAKKEKHLIFQALDLLRQSTLNPAALQDFQDFFTEFQTVVKKFQKEKSISMQAAVSGITAAIDKLDATLKARQVPNREKIMALLRSILSGGGFMMFGGGGGLIIPDEMVKGLDENYEKSTYYLYLASPDNKTGLDLSGEKIDWTLVKKTPAGKTEAVKDKSFLKKYALWLSQVEDPTNPGAPLLPGNINDYFRADGSVDPRLLLMLKAFNSWRSKPIHGEEEGRTSFEERMMVLIKESKSEKELKKEIEKNIGEVKKSLELLRSNPQDSSNYKKIRTALETELTFWENKLDEFSGAKPVAFGPGSLFDKQLAQDAAAGRIARSENFGKELAATKLGVLASQTEFAGRDRLLIILSYLLKEGKIKTEEYARYLNGFVKGDSLPADSLEKLNNLIKSYDVKEVDNASLRFAAQTVPQEKKATFYVDSRVYARYDGQQEVDPYKGDGTKKVSPPGGVAVQYTYDDPADLTKLDPVALYLTLEAKRKALSAGRPFESDYTASRALTAADVRSMAQQTETMCLPYLHFWQFTTEHLAKLKDEAKTLTSPPLSSALKKITGITPQAVSIPAKRVTFSAAELKALEKYKASLPAEDVKKEALEAALKGYYADETTFSSADVQALYDLAGKMEAGKTDAQITSLDLLNPPSALSRLPGFSILQKKIKTAQIGGQAGLGINGRALAEGEKPNRSYNIFEVAEQVLAGQTRNTGPLGIEGVNNNKLQQIKIAYFYEKGGKKELQNLQDTVSQKRSLYAKLEAKYQKLAANNSPDKEKVAKEMTAVSERIEFYNAQISDLIADLSSPVVTKEEMEWYLTRSEKEEPFLLQYKGKDLKILNKKIDLSNLKDSGVEFVNQNFLNLGLVPDSYTLPGGLQDLTKTAREFLAAKKPGERFTFDPNSIGQQALALHINLNPDVTATQPFDPGSSHVKLTANLMFGGQPEQNFGANFNATILSMVSLLPEKKRDETLCELINFSGDKNVVTAKGIKSFIKILKKIQAESPRFVAKKGVFGSQISQLEQMLAKMQQEGKDRLEVSDDLGDEYSQTVLKVLVGVNIAAEGNLGTFTEFRVVSGEGEQIKLQTEYERALASFVSPFFRGDNQQYLKMKTGIGNDENLLLALLFRAGTQAWDNPKTIAHVPSEFVKTDAYFGTVMPVQIFAGLPIQLLKMLSAWGSGTKIPAMDEKGRLLCKLNSAGVPEPILREVSATDVWNMAKLVVVGFYCFRNFAPMWFGQTVGTSIQKDLEENNYLQALAKIWVINFLITAPTNLKDGFWSSVLGRTLTPDAQLFGILSKLPGIGHLIKRYMPEPLLKGCARALVEGGGKLVHYKEFRTETKLGRGGALVASFPFSPWKTFFDGVFGESGLISMVDRWQESRSGGKPAKFGKNVMKGYNAYNWATKSPAIAFDYLGRNLFKMAADWYSGHRDRYWLSKEAEIALNNDRTPILKSFSKMLKTGSLTGKPVRFQGGLEIEHGVKTDGRGQTFRILPGFGRFSDFKDLSRLVFEQVQPAFANPHLEVKWEGKLRRMEITKVNVVSGKGKPTFQISSHPLKPAEAFQVTLNLSQDSFKNPDSLQSDFESLKNQASTVDHEILSNRIFPVFDSQTQAKPLEELFATGTELKEQYDEVLERLNEFKDKTDQEIDQKINQLKKRIQAGEKISQAEALALAIETRARMTIEGKKERAYEEQIKTVLAMEKDQRAFDVATGEGKTLIGHLRSLVDAIRGERTHLLTSDDTLARVWAQTGNPLMKKFGFEIGLAVPGANKKNEYRKMIVVGSSDMVFDCIREIMGEIDYKIERQNLLIDEIDWRLVETAGSPFIISGSTAEYLNPIQQFAHDFSYRWGWSKVYKFYQGVQAELYSQGYITETINRQHQVEVTLSDQGKDYLLKRLKGEKGSWALLSRLGFNLKIKNEAGLNKVLGMIQRLMEAETMLKAYQEKDAAKIHELNFQIIDGEIVILDSGNRPAFSSRWQDGQHEALETVARAKGYGKSSWALPNPSGGEFRRCVYGSVTVQVPMPTLGALTVKDVMEQKYSKRNGFAGTAKCYAGIFEGFYGSEVIDVQNHIPQVVIDNEKLKTKTVAEIMEEIEKAVGTSKISGEVKVKVVFEAVADRISISQIQHRLGEAGLLVIDPPPGVRAKYANGSSRKDKVAIVDKRPMEFLCEESKGANLEKIAEMAVAELISRKGAPELINAHPDEIEELEKLIEKKLQEAKSSGKLPNEVILQPLTTQNIGKEKTFVDQAGKLWHLTIASILKRGTDVKVEKLAKKGFLTLEDLSQIHLQPDAIKAGGLHIISTHCSEFESDNVQVDGRSGRQGDPSIGSRFLKLSDPLFKLYATTEEKAELAELLVSAQKAGNGRILLDESSEPVVVIEKIVRGIQKRVLENKFSQMVEAQAYADIRNFHKLQFEAMYAGPAREILKKQSPADFAHKPAYYFIFDVLESRLTDFFAKRGIEGDLAPGWDLAGLKKDLAGLFFISEKDIQLEAGMSAGRFKAALLKQIEAKILGPKIGDLRFNHDKIWGEIEKIIKEEYVKFNNDTDKLQREAQAGQGIDYDPFQQYLNACDEKGENLNARVQERISALICNKGIIEQVKRKLSIKGAEGAYRLKVGPKEILKAQPVDLKLEKKAAGSGVIWREILNGRTRIITQGKAVELLLELGRNGKSAEVQEYLKSYEEFTGDLKLRKRIVFSLLDRGNYVEAKALIGEEKESLVEEIGKRYRSMKRNLQSGGVVGFNYPVEIEALAKEVGCPFSPEKVTGPVEEMLAKIQENDLKSIYKFLKEGNINNYRHLAEALQCLIREGSDAGLVKRLISEVRANCGEAAAERILSILEKGGSLGRLYRPSLVGWEHLTLAANNQEVDKVKVESQTAIQKLAGDLAVAFENNPDTDRVKNMAVKRLAEFGDAANLKILKILQTEGINPEIIADLRKDIENLRASKDKPGREFCFNVAATCYNDINQPAHFGSKGPIISALVQNIEEWIPFADVKQDIYDRLEGLLKNSAADCAKFQQERYSFVWEHQGETIKIVPIGGFAYYRQNGTLAKLENRELAGIFGDMLKNNALGTDQVIRRLNELWLSSADKGEISRMIQASAPEGDPKTQKFADSFKVSERSTTAPTRTSGSLPDYLLPPEKLVLNEAFNIEWDLEMELNFNSFRFQTVEQREKFIANLETGLKHKIKLLESKGKLGELETAQLRMLKHELANIAQVKAGKEIIRWKESDELAANPPAPAPGPAINPRAEAEDLLRERNQLLADLNKSKITADAYQGKARDLDHRFNEWCKKTDPEVVAKFIKDKLSVAHINSPAHDGLLGLALSPLTAAIQYGWVEKRVPSAAELLHHSAEEGSGWTSFGAKRWANQVFGGVGEGWAGHLTIAADTLTSLVSAPEFEKSKTFVAGGTNLAGFFGGSAALARIWPGAPSWVNLGAGIIGGSLSSAVLHNIYENGGASQLTFDGLGFLGGYKAFSKFLPGSPLWVKLAGGTIATFITDKTLKGTFKDGGINKLVESPTGHQVANTVSTFLAPLSVGGHLHNLADYLGWDPQTPAGQLKKDAALTAFDALGTSLEIRAGKLAINWLVKPFIERANSVPQIVSNVKQINLLIKQTPFKLNPLGKDLMNSLKSPLGLQAVSNGLTTGELITSIIKGGTSRLGKNSALAAIIYGIVGIFENYDLIKTDNTALGNWLFTNDVTRARGYYNVVGQTLKGATVGLFATLGGIGGGLLGLLGGPGGAIAGGYTGSLVLGSAADWGCNKIGGFFENNLYFSYLIEDIIKGWRTYGLDLDLKFDKFAEEQENLQNLRDKAGEFCTYQTNPDGSLKRDEHGLPLVKQRFHNVQFKGLDKVDDAQALAELITDSRFHYLALQGGATVEIVRNENGKNCQRQVYGVNGELFGEVREYKVRIYYKDAKTGETKVAYDSVAVLAGDNYQSQAQRFSVMKKYELRKLMAASPQIKQEFGSLSRQMLSLESEIKNLADLKQQGIQQIKIKTPQGQIKVMTLAEYESALKSGKSATIKNVQLLLANYGLMSFGQASGKENDETKRALGMLFEFEAREKEIKEKKLVGLNQDYNRYDLNTQNLKKAGDKIESYAKYQKEKRDKLTADLQKGEKEAKDATSLGNTVAGTFKQIADNVKDKKKQLKQNAQEAALGMKELEKQGKPLVDVAYGLNETKKWLKKKLGFKK